MNNLQANLNNLLPKGASSKLKDLIRTVRACKTANEEREVIAKESAVIRTAFREGNPDYRHRNVAKLLYVHMLGYPAQFGQMECVKLIASPKFPDKRLGYLGIMLLLDENQEVLTLVTNSLKNDLNHTNIYIVGLALSTLANISSAEMARDLCAEVEKLLGDAHSYVRKKAALCAVRIIRKVPELNENFIAKAKAVFNERNHAVLLTGLTLIQEICSVNQEAIYEFRKNVPTLVRQLRGLTSASSAGEHDVSGVSDPFLQVKILHLLRILGAQNAEASEAMADVLAQVATNTDSSKNVGNSILYESVLTVMEIESEPGLRVLAVNILGKFLGNKDNNIRYVALNTLLKSIDKDVNAVQRHRKTVVDCLRDHDISIRRRALELSFALINEGNVRVMVRELLAFLEKADKEFKSTITTEICIAAENFAPNKRWHFDTILRVLRLAGNYVKDDILFNFIRLISANPEIHAYAAHKLFASLREDVSQEYLVYAGVWVVGEFADILVTESLAADEDSPAMKVSETEVIDLLESIIFSPFTTSAGREYCLISLMKLSTRFSSGNEGRIQKIIRGFTENINVELQQRSLEFLSIMNQNINKNALFERMPVPEARALRKADADEGASTTSSQTYQSQDHQQQTQQSSIQQPSSQNQMIDLLDLDVSSSTNQQAQSTPQSFDPLADLLGLTSNAPSQPQKSSGGGLLDDLGLGSLSLSHPTYEKNGIRIVFESQIEPTNNTILNIKATFTSLLQFPLTELNLQVAVPKALKIQMQPPNSTSLAPYGTTHQLMRIANPSKAPIKLRIKVSFASQAGRVDDMSDIDGFPQM